MQDIAQKYHPQSFSSSVSVIIMTQLKLFYTFPLYHCKCWHVQQVAFTRALERFAFGETFVDFLCHLLSYLSILTRLNADLVAPFFNITWLLHLLSTYPFEGFLSPVIWESLIFFFPRSSFNYCYSYIWTYSKVIIGSPWTHLGAKYSMFCHQWFCRVERWVGGSERLQTQSFTTDFNTAERKVDTVGNNKRNVGFPSWNPNDTNPNIYTCMYLCFQIRPTDQRNGEMHVELIDNNPCLISVSHISLFQKV